jgi:hypothetical protein
MKLFETFHSFNAPWQTVTLANWNKYPNPISSHVLSCDVLSRTIDAEKGLLITERLLCCRQPVPTILKSLGLGFQEEAYFHEISTLNLKNKELTAQTVNLNMRSLLQVNELCHFSVHPDTPSSTLLKQQAEVHAPGVFAAVGRLIEDVAVSRFQVNAAKGRAALENVTHRIWEEAREFEQKMSESFDHFEQKVSDSIDSFKQSVESISIPQMGGNMDPFF